MRLDLKKFLYFTIQGCIILFIIDFTLGKTLALLYDRMTVGEKARANYLIKKDTSDIVIFGSSRALYHYHSGLISDSLNMSVYNAGRSNQTILYHVALLKNIVKRHVPQVVILDINEDEFVESEKKYELLSALLPYYEYDKDIKAMYDLTNPYYKYFSWSRILPYNSSLFAILYRGLTKGRDKDINGYLEHAGQYNKALEIINNCQTKHQLDAKLKNALNDFINVCVEKNIKLMVVVSPRFAKYQCSQPEFESIKEATDIGGLRIQNYSAAIVEQRYFADAAHLNKYGAIIYSQMVVNTLRDSIKK